MRDLHVDSVIKHYGNKQLLNDVFLSSRKGDIIGLFGRNGTGKSTLLKLMFGSIDADQKLVKVGEKVIRNLSDSYGRLKYLPQDSFLPSHISVNGVIDVFCSKQEANRLRAHYELESFLKKKCSKLSTGQRRYLEIQLLLHTDADFLLFDEPFSCLAPLLKEKVKASILEHGQKKGIIITDHDHRNVLDIATRLMLIHDGRLIEVKDEQELVDRGYLPSATQ